jgi:hypothetical protein
MEYSRIEISLGNGLGPRSIRVIASAAKQSIAPQAEKWIASLRSQ